MPTSSKRRPSLSELPPGLSAEQLQAVFNDRVRDLNQLFEDYVIQPADQNVDLGTQRIVNLADPKDDLDGVNLRTLRKFKPEDLIEQLRTKATPIAGTVTFNVTLEGFGALTIYATVAASTFPKTGLLVQLTAYSIDETDAEWYGTGTIDASTDPVTFKPTFTLNQSRLGHSFAVPKYIQWNDPTVNKPNKIWLTKYYSYEIDQITAFDGTTMTLARADARFPGKAKFGSPLVKHDNQDFYLLTESQFLRAAEKSKENRWKLLHDNMCVAAVTAKVLGASNETVSYLAGVPPAVVTTNINSIRPGLRTMAGNAYVSLMFSGVLAVGQNLDGQRVDAGQSWEVLRVALGKLRKPGGVEVFIAFRNKKGEVGLVDAFQVPSAKSYGLGDEPIDRQMPYRIISAIQGPHQYDWPPSRFPRLVDSTSSVPIGIGDSDPLPPHLAVKPDLPGVPFEPNGDLMGVITKTDGGATDLRITVQT